MWAAIKKALNSDFLNEPLNDKIINWAEKSFATSAPTGAHQANTWLDITGSGYLVFVLLFSATVAVQVDGGSIYHFNMGATITPVPLFPIRFNSSLKITGSVTTSGDAFAWVVLD